MTYLIYHLPCCQVINHIFLIIYPNPDPPRAENQKRINHENTKDRKHERKLLAPLNFSQKRSRANLTGDTWLLIPEILKNGAFP